MMYEEKAKKVIENGCYDAAVELMDEELREEVHEECSPCTEEEFLSAYMEAHHRKYGVDFII